MALHGLVVPRRRTVVMPLSGTVTGMVDISRANAGSYFVPTGYTNNGATNLGLFDVSNDYGDPAIEGGTVTISGATTASPTVVTATAHGLVSGSIITVTGITGITELNTTFVVDYDSANAFKANSLATGLAIGSAGTYGGTPVVTVHGRLSQLVVAANTGFSQRHTEAEFYPLPADLFSFRWFRFRGTTAQLTALSNIQVVLQEGYYAWRRKIVQIAASGTQSTSVATEGLLAGSYTLPIAMTSTAITYQVSDDGGVWTTLTDSADTDITQTVAQPSGTALLGGIYALPTQIKNFRYFRFVAGSSEAALRRIILDLKYQA